MFAIFFCIFRLFTLHMAPVVTLALTVLFLTRSPQGSRQEPGQAQRGITLNAHACVCESVCVRACVRACVRTFMLYALNFGKYYWQ